MVEVGNIVLDGRDETSVDSDQDADQGSTDAGNRRDEAFSRG